MAPPTPPAAPRPPPIAAILVSIGVIGFLIFFARAVSLYPGGTWCHPMAHGFDPAASYFCDLTHARALGGADNALSVRSMRAAMFALGVAVFAFFQLDPRSLTRVLGGIAGVAVPLVPLFPSSESGWTHAIVVFAAAVPGIAAAVLAFLHARTVSAPMRWLAGLSIGSALLAVAFYLQMLFIKNDPCSLTLPVTQKIAAAFFFAWMIAAARRAALAATPALR